MRAWDIDRAFLHDLPLQEDAHMAIASFLVTGPKTESSITENKISADVEQAHRGEELLNPIATELANFL
jgi:hypothetical protein